MTTLDPWSERLHRRFKQSETARERSIHPTIGGMDQYLQFVYNGIPYGTGPSTTWGVNKEEPISAQYASLVNGAYKRNGIVFASILARALVFSEIRFKWRTLSDKRLFGDQGLQILENPEQRVTTGEMLWRAEQDGSLDGNWYATTRFGGLKRMRPQWVSILVDSDLEPDHPDFAADARLAAYLHKPPGGKETIFLPEEVAHWAPIPDPELRFRGMSWVSVAVREIMADNAATETRLKFFENGMTPNMVIKAPDQVDSKEKYEEWRSALEYRGAGVENQFRTLYLYSGSDAIPVGQGLGEVQFPKIQGAGETRIAMNSRVPAVILQNSEGLSGSSLNQGNYGMARRQMADGLLRPNWRSFCSAVGQLVKAPDGAELWYDESAVSFLREDEKDAAEISGLEAAALRQLIETGWEAESAKAAIGANDMTLLKHTGMVSVQLQDPNGQDPAAQDREEAFRVAEAIQKIYLGVVNGVLSDVEARAIVNRLGAGLPPGPTPVAPDATTPVGEVTP